MTMADSPGADLQRETTIDRVITRNASRTFNCTQCNGTFSRLAHLKRHQRSHRSEKPFSCSHCSVTSSRKDVIIRHTRNFHPDKAPACDVPSVRSASSVHSSASQDLVPNERVRPTMSEHQPAQQSSNNLGTLGCLGDDDFDLESPLVDWNGLLSLPNPVLSVEDMLRTSDSFQASDLCLSQTFEALSSATDHPMILHGQPNGVSSARHVIPSNVSHSPAVGSSKRRGSFILDGDEYERAKENYENMSATLRLQHFRFPTRFAITRFVMAFFEYMAPQLPVVHQPTFRISSAPPPLLLEIMAHGALCTNAPHAAEDFHITASLLIRKNEEMILTGEGKNPFQLWALQTRLLISHFEAFSGETPSDYRTTEAFAQTLKLADEALNEINTARTANYHHWVQQETLNRCLAGCIVLGAALFSKSNDRSFPLPILQAKFLLPSNTELWLKEEKDWERPIETIVDNANAFKMVLEGRGIGLHHTEFGFATVVAAILCHICSFEFLAGTLHSELYTSFVEKMDRSVRVLRDTWREHPSGQLPIQPTMTPMAHLIRSLMLSIGFHLYGSRHLTVMKRFFYFPELLDSQASLEEDFGGYSTTLDKALVTAAEMFKSDCQTGLGYISLLGHVRFGPMSIIAGYEGVLLLCWHLQNKQRRHASSPVLDELIDAALSEADASEIDTPSPLAALPLAALPLALYANSFEASVWQFVPAVSRRLTELMTQLKRVY